MGDLWNFLADDEEEGEEGNRKSYQSGRDCLVILLDGSESMFTTEVESKENGEKKCLFKHYLEAIKTKISETCLTGEKEYISLIVMNSKNTKNEHNFKHLFTWIDFDLPGIETVKTLQNMIKSTDIEAAFNKAFGGREDCAWDEAFWLAALIEGSKGITFNEKRVWVFTNTSVPGNRDALNRIKQKVDDLDGSNFDIKVYGLEKKGFESRRFWETVPSITIDTTGESVDELLQGLRERNVKKRSMGNIGFELPGGIEFSVGIFNTVAKANIPTAVNLEKKSNQEVKTVTTYFNEETGEKLLDRDMQKAQVYAKKRIALENDEVEALKRITPPGLVLLGFKPLKYLKPQHHIRTSLFLYPDEQSIRGSTTMYQALLYRCIKNEVFAVCRLTARRNMPPRLVALYPQKEIKSEDDDSIDQSSGFYVIYLPFADDMRDLSKVMEIERPVASEEQVSKASKMVQRLKLRKYDAERFRNPAIEQHYNAVEAIALQWEDSADVKVKDGTKPKTEVMKWKASREIEEFCDLVFPPGYAPIGGPKRKAGGSAAGGEAKKQRPDVNLETEARADRLGKLTVAQLKDLCSAQGINLSKTRKADIIEEIKSQLL